MSDKVHIVEGKYEMTDHWVNRKPCLVLLLNSLTHLNTLHLKRVSWINLTSELREAFRNVVVSNPVSNFEFVDCHFPSSSLSSIFNTCSTSISLTLLAFDISRSYVWQEKIKTVEKEEGRNVRSENRYRFHDFRISNCSPEVLSWLNDPECGPDLSHLQTLHCGRDIFSKALLPRLGGHLQHLSLPAPQKSCVSVPSLSHVILHSHSN
jgi:hypothetical protein